MEIVEFLDMPEVECLCFMPYSSHVRTTVRNTATFVSMQIP